MQLGLLLKANNLNRENQLARPELAVVGMIFRGDGNATCNGINKVWIQCQILCEGL